MLFIVLRMHRHALVYVPEVVQAMLSNSSTATYERSVTTVLYMPQASAAVIDGCCCVVPAHRGGGHGLHLKPSAQTITHKNTVGAV